MEIIFYLKVLIYCTIIFIKQVWKEEIHTLSLPMDSNGYHSEFKNHPERISNMHHFFSCQYNWDGIEFPAGIKDLKRKWN